ncbi:PhzF family phenazine biosynthesis protein [Brevundimonas sp.]|uniref:PhzF family phenazine biosynthesis protein n=1 Tax=Brevundimonas sp. TaxID=1871086 RepID=UPI0037C11DE9
MRQWTIDAFAARPFLGNPACVVAPVEAWASDDWMQALARENNQAETAFLRRTADPAAFDLRWFTPATEVDLCGHATLAAAHALFAEMGGKAEALTFSTRSGRLIVRRQDQGYEMDFPADPPRRIAPLPALTEALGVEPVEVWSARYLVAILADETAVRTVQPVIRAIAALVGHSVEPGQVIVCAASDDPDFDVVDRFFAPGCGIDEDPTTGSAHCILAPLFSDRQGREELRFHQAYPGRGGDLQTRMAGDRVLIRGRAMTVIESLLREP